MNRNQIKLFLWVFVFFICIACNEFEGKETRIIIFHTNDSHAQIDNFAKLAALVNEERSQNPFVFLVSTGDIFSGNPLIDNYDPPGYPKIDLMNRVKYDMSVIGNHEFDYGIKVLKNRMEQAEFPFILGNIDVGKTLLPQPEPYKIVHADGIKLTFLALLQVSRNGIPSTHPDKVKGISFEHPSKAIEKYKHLKNESHAVIALTHHSFFSDTLLAYKQDWIDVIIGGHCHTLIKEPKTYNDVLITQAGDKLKNIGKVTLIFKGNKLEDRKAEMISLDSYEFEDPDIKMLVSEYSKNPALQRVIGKLPSPLRKKSELACLFTDALRSNGSFDFAFQNQGGIRIDRLSEEISIADIYAMDPFGNELISMELSYAEMRQLIGNSLRRDRNPELHISGGAMEVYLDASNRLKEIKIFDEHGSELVDSRKYQVGMGSYIASSFNFNREDAGYSLGITTAQAIIEYIGNNTLRDYKDCERRRVIRETL
ncbi:MAG: bifunctional metallophosphatase/5'-nucleotidase [Cyclobacteriaceae bacterium]|nr:bifunctional metallophosphatase/5'-nucleotidase [Cyclobacteriaceae bacterium]